MKSRNTPTSMNLQKWHTGERKSLDTLVERNLSWVKARVRRRLGARLRRMEESSDIVQDAVVQFLMYGPRILISDERQFRALLARIVENILRDKHDWYTAKRRKIALERPLPPTTVLCLDAESGTDRTPSQSAQRHEEEAWIRLGVELLDPEDREVIVLRQWDNLTFVEIGRRLGLSADAAWMRHNRAVKRLAKKVGDLRRKSLSNALEEEMI